MPYLKPNVPYEDNRTTAEVSECAFLALKRNHESFSSSLSSNNNKTDWMLTTTHDNGNMSNDGDGKASLTRGDVGALFATTKGEETTTIQTTTTANVERLLMEEGGEIRWRIFATSDVHADMRENKEWVVRTCQKCNHPEPGTILIVAGDVATDVNKVVEALKMFKMRYQEVFYCVGNHELWSPGQGEMGDSIDKFVAIIDAATSVGVRCTPTVFTHPGKNELGMKQTQRILVVPMLSWYTETFKGGNRPFTQMEVHFDGACIWPPAIGDPKDKRNSHPVTLDEFWRRLGKRSIDSFLPKKFRSNRNNGSINISTNTNINTEDDEEKFRRDCGNEVAFLVTYGHFVPLPDLYNGTPFIEKVVGSEGLGEDILALRDECDCKSTPGSGRSSPAGFKKGRFDYNSTLKHVHVFGHSHLNVDQEIEGSRWYQRAVGYPTDRGPMPPEMPRQIYPA